MSESIKVFELAKEFNLKALDLIDKIKPLDLKLKNHMADLTAEQAERIRSFLTPPAPAEAPKKKIIARAKKTNEGDKPAAAASVGLRPSAIVLKPKTSVQTPAVASPQTPASPVSAQPTAESSAIETAQAPVAPVVPQAPRSASVMIRKSGIVIKRSPSPTPIDLTPDPLPESVEEPVVENELSAPAGEVAASSEAETPLDAAGTATAKIEGEATVAAPGAVRRGPRYSIIRVVSAEPATPKKPLIVEDAPAGGARGRNSSAPKTFTDPALARSGSALLKEIEAEEELRRKKAAAAPRGRENDANFKSTDYLRRERVYQPKKKRISIGRGLARPAAAQGTGSKRAVEFDTIISVENLAHQMSLKVYEVAKKLAELGVERSDTSEGFDDWILDFETAQILAQELGFELDDNTFREEDVLGEQPDDKDLKPRSPVITIMGHVDHGKTSLLDIIRRARVASGEAGGITQHIGAYTVNVADAIKNLASFASSAGEGGATKKDRKKDAAAAAATKKAKKGDAPAAKAERLTFLDTPGHAAFTSMRSRGAKITDIVILVVSAIDGVMPQTKEAIDHARAANVPLIVAVNKMDLPDANPDRIKKQLGELNVLPEDWGGDTIFVGVSAKTGEGVDKLLEMIQLQAELLDLKAKYEGSAEGTIIEARLDKGRGPLATVLIRNGTIKVGEYVVAGTQYGKVRALIDDKGANTKEAGPSTPVEILGLAGVPEAGEAVNTVGDEKSARTLAEHRTAQKKAEDAAMKPMSLEDLYSRMAAGDLKELPVILKADVKGSAEAIQAALLKLPMNKVRLKILAAAVGGISESDVLLASASSAIILGFNVRPDNKSESEAERRGVQIKTYNIIYNLIDDVTKAMEGLLDPTVRETVMGRAEVRSVFANSKVGAVAGCSVVKGKVQRSNMVRLIRDGRVIYTGKISGLRRFKDDAKEVAEGFECGISIENYSDIKEGDIIEAFMTENFATKLSEGNNSANA